MMDLRRDYLSQLPDELIIRILSKLTLKEAGRTSLLSRRWKNLWLLTMHCSGPNLIFRTPLYDDLDEPETHVERKRLLYIGLLNKVFMLHQQPLLDELDIDCCILGSKYYSTIDYWIMFAFAKGVQRLELTIACGDSEFKRPYAFPSMRNVLYGGSGIPRLRDLCLRGLCIDQKNLDALLSTCPLLESLSLTLYRRGDLNVSSAKLKHLDLFCFSSSNRKLEISTPSLVSFAYKGSASVLHLKCIPSLSAVYMWDADPSPFFTKLDMLLSYVSQLKKLSLFLCDLMLKRSPSYPTALPKLVKLEEFEVEVWGIDGDSFLWPTVFIQASPFLRKFCAIVSASYCSGRFHSEEEKRRIDEGTKFTHQFLKVVEIRRFGGWTSEMELAQRLIHIGARSLEKVIVDTRSPRYYDYGAEDRKKLALSLGQGLDSRVDLVVL